MEYKNEYVLFPVHFIDIAEDVKKRVKKYSCESCKKTIKNGNYRIICVPFEDVPCHKVCPKCYESWKKLTKPITKEEREKLVKQWRGIRYGREREMG